MSTFAIALDYARAGLCVLPADGQAKRPAVASWKEYQRRLPSETELRTWFATDRPLCLLTGAVSGNLELLDFDGAGEKFAWWRQLVTLRAPELAARLVLERSPSGGWHVLYRCQSPVCGNIRLAQRAVVVVNDAEVELYGKRYQPRRVGDRWEIVLTLIETRGEGGIFLCAPSPGYAWVQGDVRNLPVLTVEDRELLLELAWSLDELQRAPEPEPTAPVSTPSGDRPGDDYNGRGDVRALLRAHGWTLVRGGDNEHWCRPGKTSGTSATLKERVWYVFSSNAAPFEPGRAYAPFSVFALLEHGGDYSAAATALRAQGFGDADEGTPITLPVLEREAAPASHLLIDPGPIPDTLLQVPGFVAEVMRYTCENAPYPSIPLAFCGAMALQSYLCARKVCDAGDLRPNIYLLALASSGTGKDFPRKVNARVLFEIGHVASLGDKFASGEGIQDALLRTGAMLFQNDEMDGVLRQINLDRENKRESIPNILLTLYTSASEVYPLRTKANQKEAGHIDQPHLTLFGTATPKYFYESLSQRMLTNGFFARMMIVDVGKRGVGQSPGSSRQLPESILEVARWWSDFQPGTQRKNLLEVHPEPRIVPYTADADAAVRELQRLADGEYERAHEANDEMARVAWSRTCENAKKLALLYACSVNHRQPQIDTRAVDWAARFAMHQTRRQLYLATIYVAENPFHAECLKLVRKVQEAGGQMARNQLMRAMRCKVQDFDQMIATLVMQGDLLPIEMRTKTKTAVGYRLV